MLELQAKIVEEDDKKRDDIIKSLGRFEKVIIRVVNDQIQIIFEGGEKEIGAFAEIMRICEISKCHMFRIRQR